MEEGAQVWIGGSFHTQATFPKEEPRQTAEVVWTAEAVWTAEVGETEDPPGKYDRFPSVVR